MKTFILLASLLMACTAQAEIYVITDKDGRKTYTDTPPPDLTEAKPVDVSPQIDSAWKQDSIQQQNDRYFDSIIKKREQEKQESQAATEMELKARKDRESAITDAEQALEEAREIKAGDFYRTKQGGIRYSQEYRDRVRKAEEDLDKAQQTDEN